MTVLKMGKLLDHMHPGNFQNTGLLPSLASDHKNMKLHDSLFPRLYRLNNRAGEYTHACFSRNDVHTESQAWDKRGRSIREDMLLSPICVPSVCKLHQQHELDQHEKEPASGCHVAPNCGIEQKKRQKKFNDKKSGMTA